MLFVRENKEDTFHCLGFARPESYVGEKPILMTWKLEHQIPEAIYPRFLAAS